MAARRHYPTGVRVERLNPKMYEPGQPTWIEVADHEDATVRSLDTDQLIPGARYQLFVPKRRQGKVYDSDGDLNGDRTLIYGAKVTAFEGSRELVEGFVETDEDSGVFVVERWWQSLHADRRR